MHLDESMKKDSLRILILLVVIVLTGGFVAGKLTNWGQVAQVVTSNAQVQIPLTVTGTPVNVPSVFYGENLSGYFSRAKYYKKNPSQYNSQTGYTLDPYLETAVDDLGMKVLRFPSGDDSKYYHLYKPDQTTYAKGYGFRSADIQNDISTLGEHDVVSVYGGYSNYLAYEQTLPEGRNFIFDFIDLAKQENAKAMFLVNVKYGSIDEALGVIALLKQNGVSIAGVELGEETYSERAGFSKNPELFLQTARAFAVAIKAQHPEIKIGLSAAPYRSEDLTSFEVNDAWNTRMVQAMNSDPLLYDAYIYHAYPQLECDSVQTRELIFDCAIEHVGFASNFDSAQEANSSLGLSVNTPTITEALNYYTQKFSGKKMWITEWSLSHRSGSVYSTAGYYGNTLLNAMFNASFRHVLNKWNTTHQNIVQYAIHHNMTGSNAFALISPKSESEASLFSQVSIWIKRALYHETNISKKIYTRNMKFLNTAYSTSEPVDVYTYLDQQSNSLYVYFINRSGKSVSFPTVTYNGQSLNTHSTASTVHMMSGQTPSSTVGIGGGSYPFIGDMISVNQFAGTSVSSVVVPPYAYGYLTVPVNIVIPNHAPEVTISSPTLQSTYTTQVPLMTFSGSLNDESNDALSLSWKISTQSGVNNSGTTENNASSWTVDGVSLVQGVNVFEISATDPQGLTSTDTVSVTYTPVNDTQKPKVKLLEPIGNNLILQKGTSVIFRAEATDNVGIQKVEFYLGNSKVCTDISFPYECTVVLPPTPGYYSYRVFAYDFKNNNDFKSQPFTIPN